MRGDDTIIQDNYIHGMEGPPSAHFDSIQADGAFKNLTIEHSTVINEHGQTSTHHAGSITWGPIDNVKINNNLLIGGGYTVYLAEVVKASPVAVSSPTPPSPTTFSPGDITVIGISGRSSVTNQSLREYSTR